MLWVVGALVVVIAASAVVAVRLRGGSTHEASPQVAQAQDQSSADHAACTSELRVVTAASYAPVLRQVARSLATGRDCVGVQVTVADGVSAAATVASSTADVWIPDDESWAQLPNTLHLATGPTTVLATSPMYLVTLRSGPPLPASDRSLLGLGATLGQQGPWSLVVRDPAASGDGMVAAGDLATAVGNSAGPLVSALDMMRAWQHATTSTAVSAALPTRPDQVALVAEYALLQASKLSDYSVMAPGDRPVLLRYSWFPTAAALADPTRSAALQRLRQALTAPSADGALDAAGLRAAAWPASAPRAATHAGLPTMSGIPAPVLSAHWMYHVLSTWSPALRRANVLVVIDVSGSMADPAPGTTTAKIDLVRQGLSQATALWPATSRVGIWQFGFQLAPPNDWQSLVPIASLTAAQLALITQATAKLQAQQTGTGLYSTILAAYQQVQNSFVAGIPNEVLVFTDGIDQDDPGSMSLTQLQAGLAGTDPHKRVQLSIFGFGGAVPTTPLTSALAPVGGQVDQLASADEAIGAFVHAVSGGLSGSPE